VADDTERELAIKRLKEKRSFTTNIVAYVIINAFLVGIWAVSGGGYFWPAWVLLGWGIGIAFHAWEVYGQKPITEADIEEEIRRSRGHEA
jgi:2TM domain